MKKVNNLSALLRATEARADLIVAVCAAMLLIGLMVPQAANGQTDSVENTATNYDVRTRINQLFVARIPANVPFQVVQQRGTLKLVQFSRPTVPVWTSSDYLRIENNSAEVIVDRLNARIRASISAPVINTLALGYSSPVRASRNNFVQILAPADWMFWIDVSESKMDSQAKSNWNLAQSNERSQLTAKANDAIANSKTAGVGREQIVEFPGSPAAPEVSSQEADSKTGPETRLETGPETSPAIFQETVASKTRATRSSRVHRLAPGDSISLVVFGEPDLSISDVRIEQSGSVSFPLIGYTEVAGKTTQQVEEVVKQSLAGGYINNPKISVTIERYRPIFIRGAVQTTGAFPYAEGLTVAKALASAGGTKNSARISGISVLRDGNLVQESLSRDSQYEISSGDIITVDEELGASEGVNLFVYLHGEVQSPGEYRFRRGLTIEKAIVLAGGFTLRGSPKRVSVSRMVEGELEPEKLKKVKLFLPVEPGDIINVGARWF